MAPDTSVSHGSDAPPAGHWRPIADVASGQLPSCPSCCVALRPRATLYSRDLFLELRFSPLHILPNGLEDLPVVIVPYHLRRPLTASEERTIPVYDLDSSVHEGLELRVREREVLLDRQLLHHVVG